MPVVLKPKREKPVIQNHPWIFSGAIDKITGEPEDGDMVDILDNKWDFLARGYINRKSQITIRVMTRKPDENIDREFFAKRIRNAIDYRQKVLSLENYTAYRMVHDASDMLPGLIVDKYGDYLVVQILTLGMDVRKDIIAETLQELLKPKGIYERSDSRIRLKEGLQQYKGILRGQEPPDEVEIKQNGARFLVNFKEGQKTGKFLDQRENIQITASYARGREILDCFCYTGSFTVWCGLKGAKKITGLDISKKALATARRNIKINDIKDKCQLIQGDVFHVLETCRRKFDMIILDPPGFAKSKRAIKGAARGYKYINMAAMKLLNPDGILVTFSCSHHVNLDLFRKIVFGASVDAECNLRIIRTLQAAPDHPINISHPESEYLKGLICQIM